MPTIADCGPIPWQRPLNNNKGAYHLPKLDAQPLEVRILIDRH